MAPPGAFIILPVLWVIFDFIQERHNEKKENSLFIVDVNYSIHLHRRNNDRI